MTVHTKMAALLTLSAALFTGSSEAAVPSCGLFPEGRVFYSSNQCARGPCYKYRVTGMRRDAGIFSVAVYGNGYYEWVYIRNDLYRCN